MLPCPRPLRRAKKNKAAGEDELKRLSKDLEAATDAHVQGITKEFKLKEANLLS
jgi:ribosome recycling factor